MPKLTDEHVEQVCRLAAIGEGPAKIARILAEGVKTEHGSLPAVQVDEGTIRYRIRTNADRINAWRVEMYGSAMQDPIAWVGWRLKEYRKLYELALAATVFDANKKRQIPRPDVRTAASILRDVATELSTIAPKDGGPSHQHLHLHGKDAPQLAAGLAAKLSEYARAGVLPEAIEVLRGGAPGLELDPIETTAQDAPEEATAAAP
jgi:hypothetical protein